MKKNNLIPSEQKGVIQFLLILILLVGIVAGVYLVQKTQIFKPKAYESNRAIASLSNQLLTARDNYITEGSQNESLQTMINLASRRKDTLLEELATNPRTFLEDATLYNKRGSFPQEVQQYIEQKIIAEGTIEVSHIDNFQGKESQNIYFLQSNTGSAKDSYSLYFISDQPQLTGNTKVKVEGIALNSILVLDTNGNNIQIQSVSPPYPETDPISGDQKTAVILIKYNDNLSPNYERDDIEQSLFANSDSMNDYYKENSYDKVSFSGDIFGPYQLPTTPGFINPPSCAVLFVFGFRSINYTVEYLSQTYPELNSYNRWLLVFDHPTDCGLNGMAYVGLKNPAVSIISGLEAALSASSKRKYLRLISAHELGHSLGLAHANALYCGDNKPIDEEENCQSEEYMDFSDTMGLGQTEDKVRKEETVQFNAPHKVQLGWVPREQIKLVSADGEFNITPLEDNSSNGYKVLEITKSYSSKSGAYYFISYRRPIGYDSNIRPDFTEGASIHTSIRIHVGFDKSLIQTNLIDMTPDSNKAFTDPVLKDGQSFYDPVNRIKITQLSHDQEGAIVKIEFNQ